MIRITETVKHLLIINVLIFIATMYVFPGLPEVNPFFTFLKNFQEKGALYYPGSRFFHWYQLITHMFLHGNFSHLFFNMFALRSEEHTSELQSRGHLVCRLLLEQKNCNLRSLPPHDCIP